MVNSNVRIMLVSSYTREDESLHGGCPALLGVKWVSNKWVREGAQLWVRPCRLTDNIL